MYDGLRSLDPRQRRGLEQRLAVLAYASTCSMNAAALSCRRAHVSVTCVHGPWRARASVKAGRRPFGHSLPALTGWQSPA